MLATFLVACLAGVALAVEQPTACAATKQVALPELAEATAVVLQSAFPVQVVQSDSVTNPTLLLTAASDEALAAFEQRASWSVQAASTLVITVQPLPMSESLYCQGAKRRAGCKCVMTEDCADNLTCNNSVCQNAAVCEQAQPGCPCTESGNCFTPGTCTSIGDEQVCSVLVRDEDDLPSQVASAGRLLSPLGIVLSSLCWWHAGAQVAPSFECQAAGDSGNVFVLMPPDQTAPMVEVLPPAPTPPPPTLSTTTVVAATPPAATPPATTPPAATPPAATPPAPTPPPPTPPPPPAPTPPPPPAPTPPPPTPPPPTPPPPTPAPTYLKCMDLAESDCDMWKTLTASELGSGAVLSPTLYATLTANQPLRHVLVTVGEGQPQTYGDWSGLGRVYLDGVVDAYDGSAGDYAASTTTVGNRGTLQFKFDLARTTYSVSARMANSVSGLSGAFQELVRSKGYRKTPQMGGDKLSLLGVTNRCDSKMAMRLCISNSAAVNRITPLPTAPPSPPPVSGACTSATVLCSQLDKANPVAFGSLQRSHISTWFTGGTVAGAGALEDMALVRSGGMTYIRQRYIPISKGSERVNFRVTLSKPGLEMYQTYKLYFEPGFEAVKGGKLPGLAGGSMPTGGSTRTDGFSARFMWRGSNQLAIYAYHHDRPSIYGEDIHAMQNGQRFQWTTGRWYEIGERIKMNSNGGTKNGVGEIWIDGVKMASRTNLRWRVDSTNDIDMWLYSSFYGGNDPSWAPSKTTYVRVRDIRVGPTAQSVGL